MVTITIAQSHPSRTTGTDSCRRAFNGSSTFLWLPSRKPTREANGVGNLICVGDCLLSIRVRDRLGLCPSCGIPYPLKALMGQFEFALSSFIANLKPQLIDDSMQPVSLGLQRAVHPLSDR